MPHLALQFPGPFQAALDSQPIPGFESNKVRALLAYLAVEADRPHSCDELIGLLWPEQPDATARANLRQVTRENWKTRAVCRTDGEIIYYTYVARGKHSDGEKEKWVYGLIVDPLPLRSHEYTAYFRKLDEALARANGEDGF